MGGVDTPQIRVVEALDIYWTLTKDRTLGKSKDQIRRWKNPRIKAINNFVAVNGDLALAEITPDHMLHFKDMWLDRIQNEGLTRNSANKDFGHFADVLNTLHIEKRLHLNLPIC